ncbi:MAG: hypothetical protein RBS39_06755 [Phycisphaerales bacterium]|jgi:hypothetical protein|nr:hypothetical protein [Phycisphaerales bacterium]
MNRSLGVVCFALAGLGLVVMPQVHAAVREANALFALGIAHRAGETGALTDPWAASMSLAPIPGTMHWVSWGAAWGAC